jgi:hypothetical protein
MPSTYGDDGTTRTKGLRLPHRFPTDPPARGRGEDADPHSLGHGRHGVEEHFLGADEQAAGFKIGEFPGAEEQDDGNAAGEVLRNFFVDPRRDVPLGHLDG